MQDGEERPIAFASKSLSSSQTNYCTTMRELLAVVYFVKYWHHYLWGKKFVLRTDHSSLTWLVNFKEPQAMLARWLSALGNYTFDIVHRKGNLHSNADGLSRQRPKKCKREDCLDCSLEIKDCVCTIFENQAQVEEEMLAADPLALISVADPQADCRLGNTENCVLGIDECICVTTRSQAKQSDEPIAPASDSNVEKSENCSFSDSEGCVDVPCSEAVSDGSNAVNTENVDNTLSGSQTTTGEQHYKHPLNPKIG